MSAGEHPTPSSESARATILGRIREALRLAAPLPHLHGDEAEKEASAHVSKRSLKVLPLVAARPWLPDGGANTEESLRIFAENSAKLKSSVHRVTDSAAAATFIKSLISERGWRRVAYHSRALPGDLTDTIPCEGYCIDGERGFDKDYLEGCDAGITLCDALVAQTGSILVSSATCGGRALSIVPHVHIVVASANQVVPTVGDALTATKERYQGRMPSMVGFITGPSRTGDIERILVLGAHGPKELFVVIVG